MYTHAFTALGTVFEIKIWDPVSSPDFAALCQDSVSLVAAFDALYSRFKADSLITQLSTMVGTVTVPSDLVTMLRLYQDLSDATNGKITPTIGFALEDVGYDASYSFKEQTSIRSVPPLDEALSIIDDTHITLHQPVLLDLGALGKGYVVDMLFALVRQKGMERFLINGSGDIRYHGAGESIVCALEHPLDTTQAIGTLSLNQGALCASAINRRRWGPRHHYIDPHTQESPQDIIATWVCADTAALADAVSSALFFVSAEVLSKFSFEYLVVRKDLALKRSAGFTAELF